LVILSSGKRDLSLATPWVNLPGTAGFSDELRDRVEAVPLGAFVTNPVSLSPRQASRPPRVLSYPGGFLLHTGHPNPGLRRVILSARTRWASMNIPIMLTLLAQDRPELVAMARAVEPVGEIEGLVILLDRVTMDEMKSWMEAAEEAQRPVVAALPLDVSKEVACAAAESGAQALLLGPPRGSLATPAGTVSGRLFGPAVFPLALQAVMRLAPVLDVPLLASGGVGGKAQAQALMEAGASAVGLDYILWRDPRAILGSQATMNESDPVDLPPKGTEEY
jgi:dihydroorotate dehydrogenase (NAD+) catalytic subunit